MKATGERNLWKLRWKTAGASAALVCLQAIAGCGVGFHLPSITSPIGVAILEVTAFGATGNGVTDDTDAIQRALDAAATQSATVHFACGQYLVQTVSVVAPGARSILYMSGGNGVTITGEGSCSHIFTKVAQKSLLEVSGGSNITVSNLYLTAVNTIYKEQYGFGGGSALRMSSVHGGTVTQLTIDGATAGAIYLTTGTSNVTVSDNSIHDTYGAGIWEDDCGGENNRNCLPSMPPSGNVYESNTLLNTTLAQLSAIDLDDGNGSSNAMVENNTISWTKGPLASNPGVHCIQVNNASDVTVSGNSCTATPWDGIVITTGVGGEARGDVVENNTILNTGFSAMGGSGIVVYDSPQGNGISGFTITGNTITTAGDDGIRVYAASAYGNIQGGSVTLNTIHDSDQRNKGTRFGIDVENSQLDDTTGNVITGDGTCIAVGFNAIQTNETVTSLNGNTISNILGIPIDIH
jgi:Pectate lyase superfamily protein/Right handed beta helix region